jgi:hypothetical protein
MLRFISFSSDGLRGFYRPMECFCRVFNGFVYIWFCMYRFFMLQKYFVKYTWGLKMSLCISGKFFFYYEGGNMYVCMCMWLIMFFSYLSNYMYSNCKKGGHSP